MPAGERVATVQPGLVQTPTSIPGGENAMERLQKAFEAGILNYNEIADGLTVRPAERAKKQADFQAAMKDRKFSEETRPLRETIQKSVLEGAKAQTAFDTAVTQARTGFHTPADIAELGRMGAAGDVLDAEGNLASKEAMIRKAHDFIDDPEGLKQYYRESTLKLGGTVDPGMNMDQLKLAFQTALTKSEERSVNKLRLEAMLDRYVKSGENSGKLESDLRKEFYGNERVTIYNKTAPMYAKIRTFAGKAARGEELTSADDMGIIFSYMKILDPGSTVREGEYATAEQTRGLPEHVVALYNKAWTGQKLTPTQRENFATAAETAFQPHKAMYDALRKDFVGLADKVGVDPKSVVGSENVLGLESATPGGSVVGAPGAKAPPKPATNAALPPGVSYVRLKDGRVVKAQKLPDGSFRVVR